MIYIIPAAALAVCALSFALFYADIKKHPLPSKNDGGTEKAEDNEDMPETENRIPKKSMIIYSILMIAVTMGISVLFCTLYKENDILTSLKHIMLTALIWPLAYIDIKTMRIPNSFIIAGLILRAVIIPFEIFALRKAVIYSLLADLIAAAVIFAASGLCALFIKNSIGAGDIKLFIVMGLMLGLNSLWPVMFTSLIVTFFAALFLLITKKKSRKDSMPFAPTIVAGTFLAIALTGM